MSPPITVTYKEVTIRILASLIAVRAARTFGNLNVALAAVFAVNILFSTSVFTSFSAFFSPTFGESFTDKLASLLLNFKLVRKEYSKHIDEHVKETKEDAIKNWPKFGKLITSIPEEGMQESEILQMLDHVSSVVSKGIVDDDISGSIYPYAYKTLEMKTRVSNGHPNVGVENMGGLMASLERLFGEAFRRSWLWNSLHEGEFGVGYWLNYQVIRMVASIFTKKQEETEKKVMGIVTTGGTDSLMNMTRIYFNWGKEVKNLDFGQPVIITCQNVHAAVDKGCQVSGIHLIKVPTNEEGSISMPLLLKTVEKYKRNLIAIVVSAPSYTLGAFDDIKAAAKIASKYSVGLHVDCCLGGFVANFLDYDTSFLDVEGVTSISCDTHKNGWAPKGSSVLLLNPLRGRNLAFYSAYSIPDWDGGVYGSPGNPGSQHCSHVLQAYVGMLRIGRKGYTQLAQKINTAVNGCIEVIRKDPRVIPLGEHHGKVNRQGVNIVAFKIDDSLGWGVGASYALAHEMSQRKVIMSALKADRIHFAVTGRSACDPEFVKRFEKAFIAGMEATEKSAQLVLEGKAKFGGSAGLYGTLNAAMEPTAENTKSVGDRLGNMLLGKRVARDLIKAHFCALQNPFDDKDF